MLKFYHFTATLILREITFWGVKTVQNVNWTILEVLNFDFCKFEQISSPQFTKIQSSASLKLPLMTFLDRLNPPNVISRKIRVAVK